MAPNIDIPVDLFLLRRYVAGDCTPSERARIAAWVASAPERQVEVDALRQLHERAGELLHDFDTRTAWAAVAPRVGSRTPLGRSRPAATRSLSYSAWRLTAIAATIVIAVAGSAGVWRIAPRISLAQQVRQFATPAGGRATVTLRDGTQLTLGPATRLLVPADFGRRTRTVELDGEAYFTVVHDPARPFTVHARNAVATDIGTAFDVRAYVGDPAVRVAVVQGEVGVAAAKAADHNRPVQAGDIATVTDTGVVVRHGANVAAATAWVQGGLVFVDTPLRDAVQDLARIYDVDIVVRDSTLLSKRLSGAFNADERADDVLTAVTFSIGARYQRAGRRVVILRRAAGAGQPVPVHVSDTELLTARAIRPSPLSTPTTSP
jgi:ferric-dicitrate binding protein FerR (iron transport regulator)